MFTKVTVVGTGQVGSKKGKARFINSANVLYVEADYDAGKYYLKLPGEAPFEIDDTEAEAISRSGSGLG